jgi:hypothetical protein
MINTESTRQFDLKPEICTRALWAFTHESFADRNVKTITPLYSVGTAIKSSSIYK